MSGGVMKKKPAKRYVCIDLEMTEFTPGLRGMIPGANGEVIQFGAVMLDENYNMISKFSSYVKPVYSEVTPRIQELTGISNNNLTGADDFITVFDKFRHWRGDGDIKTFCWSNADHNQLWCELTAKAKHRYDLYSILRDYVDLQKIFGQLLSSKGSVSLESAMKLLQMDFKGQVHSALSDSYNTARILHKIFCTENLTVDFDYINPSKKNQPKPVEDARNYSCSFASFMSSELLAQFNHTDSEPVEEINEYAQEELEEEETILLENTPLAGLVDDAEIMQLCEKYKISFNEWIKLATAVLETEEMCVL